MLDINELRAEVARRRKAAQSKIARLRRKGVRLEGSQFDVRRDPHRVGRYNSRQLQSYLGELNEFTQRRVQFVPGVEGTPIRAHVFKHAQRTANEYNAMVQKHEQDVSNIFIPKAGMTAGEFMRDVVGTRKRGKGGKVRPLTVEARNSFEFVSEDKIMKWRESMERKMRPNYLNDSIEKQKYKMYELIDHFGDDKLSEIAKSLSSEQVNVLWNYTDAPRDMFNSYYMARLTSTGKADDTFARIDEDSTSDVKDWLEWASNLSPQGNRSNRR